MPLKLSQAAIRLRTTVRDVVYYLAPTDPSANDDRNDNYVVGSRWINTVTREEYVCVDNTQVAAVWKPTTTGGGGGGGGTSAHIASSDPTAMDDYGAGYPEGTMWVNVADNTAFISVDSTNDAAVWREITERIPSASEIPATPSLNNSGTTVQAQLDILSNSILGLGAFIVIRVVTIAGNYGVEDTLHQYTVVQSDVRPTVSENVNLLTDDLTQYTVVYPPVPLVVPSDNTEAI